MSFNFEIKLKRESKVYNEGELLTGSVIFHCQGGDVRHDGINLYVEGSVGLQYSTSKTGIFETFNAIKSIGLLQSHYELSSPGKLTTGFSEFHFEIPLKCCNKEISSLYESYSGIYINIKYNLRCDMKPSSFMSKVLQKSQPFCIQNKLLALKNESDPIEFSVCSLQKLKKERIVIPRFLITGTFDTSEFCISKPLTGNVSII